MLSILLELLPNNSTRVSFLFPSDFVLRYPIGSCISPAFNQPGCFLIPIQIVTLFIFSLIVAGLSTYTIYDFSIIISVAKTLTKKTCKGGVCWLIFPSVEGTLLGLAILVLLLSSWAIICCIASCCCHTEVEPEPMPTQQQQQVSSKPKCLRFAFLWIMCKH